MISLELTAEHLQYIQELVSRGGAPARTIRRAQILRLRHEGYSSLEIAGLLHVCDDTVRNTIHRYLNHGLQAALYDGARSGRPVEIDESSQQRIVALACSAAPAGYARWTVKLLTQESRRQQLAEHIGRETVRTLLKHHDLHPWREKNVVRSSHRSIISAQNERCARGVRTAR